MPSSGLCLHQAWTQCIYIYMYMYTVHIHACSRQNFHTHRNK
ncbi:rCG57043 [Rattus norvegicus]|uniref:RCG57043 n=1 Tax=Rattus norvegicus TaxID=10116 RepID=A6JD07_RAT|nr:rCG57043 [Rattus norvegicus]